MTPQDTLNRLDQLIQDRSILCHPFYIAWQRGDLTREQLATYAHTYYPHVAAFPRYLGAAAAEAKDEGVRSELQGNLSDELNHPKPHNELWLDFAEALGLNRRAVADDVPRPAAARIVDTFSRLTQGETAVALAALYAYESQQPEVAQQKREGLQKNYGIDHPAALAYFDVHATTDIDHRDGERRSLIKCLAAGASPEAVFDAANQAIAAYWGLLSGICEEAGL